MLSPEEKLAKTSLVHDYTYNTEDAVHRKEQVKQTDLESSRKPASYRYRLIIRGSNDRRSAAPYLVMLSFILSTTSKATRFTVPLTVVMLLTAIFVASLKAIAILALALPIAIIGVFFALALLRLGLAYIMDTLHIWQTLVYVSLTGSERKSQEVKVGSHFTIFNYYEMELECAEDLGDISAVTVRLDHSKLHFQMPGQYRFIFYFKVIDLTKKGFPEKLFPCYHWIGAENNLLQATSKTATLQKSNTVEATVIEDQLKQRRKKYVWVDKGKSGKGIPPFIKGDFFTLPIDEHFEKDKLISFLWSVVVGKVAGTSSAVLSKILRIPNQLIGRFEFIKQQVKNLEHSVSPSLAEVHIKPTYKKGYNWTADVHFGRQILNGVNPVIICKCSEVPKNFGENADIAKKVQPLLREGKTLYDEIKDGRVYMCDLREIFDSPHHAPLPTKKGYYCSAPICLLYVNSEKHLVPIAIQLTKNGPVFLPTDNKQNWLLAKMFYRTADAQVHELLSHYLTCHATMEVFCIATMRNIPDSHPVYKLLRHHFRYTMAINSLARARLINPDNGSIPQNFAVGKVGMVKLFEIAAEQHNINWTNIKYDLERRGVDNQDELPGYYYRDDGVKIWNAIEEYAQTIIDMFYDDNNEVKNDEQVQKWAKEIHDKFSAFKGQAPRGNGYINPEKIDSKGALTKYCTLIMFTGSAQHTAINYGQFETYGYTPNAPIAMIKQPPNEDEECPQCDDHLMEYLPDNKTAAMAASITFTLSQFGPDEIYLGDYPDHWFAEEKAKDAVKKLKTRLERLDEEIDKRNDELADDEYIYLRPNRVPNSITI